jgi:DNA-binding transcriptional regulator YiaG
MWRHSYERKKKDTFVYNGLGFPIRLVNVPLKKVFGEWVIDINFNALQLAVLSLLARKHSPLTGRELRFIMDYLEMSTRDFAKLFGVTHAAVLKWESEASRMNPSTEVYMRLYILNYLKVTDKEFRKLYLEINPKNITDTAEDSPLEIDVNKIAC